jgi:hypothetical protein
VTDTRYTLTHTEVLARLYALGLDIKLSTLKRWAYEGLIEKPQRYKKGKGGKKGRAVKWSMRAVEEACAVWAVRNSNITKVPPSKSRIEEVKHEVERVYRYPAAIYILRRLVKSPLKRDDDDSPSDVFTVLNTDKVTMKLVDDDEMHKLITAWITAIEKARKGWPIPEPVKVIFHWHAIPIRSEMLAGHPQKRWDHDDRADVCDYELEGVSLDKATQDEVVFLIDGEDSRTHAVFVG